MILRQLFDHDTYTYTYLIADESSNEACLIDPVVEQTDLYIKLLNELSLNLVLALDTHVHADHVTALGALRDKTGCKTFIGSKGDVQCASAGLEDKEVIFIGDIEIRVLFTPGHTNDSYSFYLPAIDNGYLFSGDTLLIRGTGRTDFQQGDAGMLYDSLHQKLLVLPKKTVVYPAHDYKGWTSSTLEEEALHNPRLQLADKQAFITHMGNLHLPNPKMMDIAVPANKACGQRK